MIPTSTNLSIDVAGKLPAKSDAIAVLLHKQLDERHPEMQRIPPDIRKIVQQLKTAGAVTGKSNDLTIQVLDDGRRLIVVGLGNIAVFSGECLREGGGVIARAAKKLSVRNLAVIVPPLPEQMPGRPGIASAGAGLDVGMDALVTGLLLTGFEWTEYRGKVTGKKSEPAHVTLIVPERELKQSREIAKRAAAIADSQNLARTIAFRPGNEINPPSLATLVKQIANQVGLTCRVLDEKAMKRLGMGGILAVGGGSNRTPPRIVVLEHRGAKIQNRRSKTDRDSRTSALGPRPLLLVGKGITFDTGGLSIKSTAGMLSMVFDKCGAMTVLGVMCAIAKLKIPVNVVGILACAENHISETSYRPSDILRMYNGVTVEVTNTDAEGRLVLGDAIAWGIDTYQPTAVVDLATLTYGVGTALGTIWAGLMSNDDGLAAEIARAADNVGEKTWRLPLSEEVNELLKSDVADIINDGNRYATALQGGAFLSYFIPEDGKTPWVHLDIASVADTKKELPYYGKGATGWGVRTLVNWISTRTRS